MKPYGPQPGIVLLALLGVCWWSAGAGDAAEVDFTQPAFVNHNHRWDLDENLPEIQAEDGNVRLVTVGFGTWLAVWDSNYSFGNTVGNDHDIICAASTDSGRSWTPSRPVNNNSGSDQGSDRYPDLAADAAGSWLAVWQSITTDGAPLFKDFDILFARSSDNGGSWSNPAPLNPNQGSEEHDDTFPQVASTGPGRWLVVWESADDLGGTIGNDDDILFALSDDNGVNWDPAQPINNNATGDAGEDLFPDIAGDGGQVWLAVWQSNGPVLGETATESGNPDIFMARSGDDGQT